MYALARYFETGPTPAIEPQSEREGELRQAADR
jgi:hypothetical protein